MAEDPYAHEVQGEELAEQKALHRPMRSWYVDSRNAELLAAHGPFPAFWQDLAKWPGWRPVRKAFLTFQDTGSWPPEEKKALLAAVKEKEEEEEEESPKVPEPEVKDEEEVSEDEIVRELFEPMRAWYASSSSGMSAQYGAFPPTAHAMRCWTAFKKVTSAFLDSESSHKETGATKRRRSRFGDASGKRRRRKQTITTPEGLVLSDPTTTTTLTFGTTTVVVAPTTLPGHGNPVQLTREQRQEVLLVQMKLRTNQERTMNFAAEFDKWLKDPKRPPSPAPIYGPDGKRANTAEVRFKQELARDRSELLAKLARLQPSAAAAFGGGEPLKKPSRKLYIPIKEYPNVCFMGLILGPRGNHHKRMEKDSGCKIRIRGRGSLREGSRGKDAQRDYDDEKDELHVYVEGDTDEAVQAAVEMVEPLLNPESKAVEELKDKHQLELAEINGTVRGDDYCHICGEKGHKQWECPAKQRSYAMANVRCALCGDTSHPTRDCSLNQQTTKRYGGNDDGDIDGALQKGQVASIDEGTKKADSQFLDFMTEIGADPGLGFENNKTHTTAGTTLPVPGAAPTTTGSPFTHAAATNAATTVATTTVPTNNSSSASVARTVTHVPRPIQFAQQQPPRVWFSQSPNDAWYYQQQQQQQAAAYNQYYAGYYQQQQQHQQAWTAYAYAQAQQHAAYYQQQPNNFPVPPVSVPGGGVVANPQQQPTQQPTQQQPPPQ